MFCFTKILIVSFFVLFIIPVSAFAGEPITLNLLLKLQASHPKKRSPIFYEL